MNTVNAEILAGIQFGGFGYTSSHKNIGGFKFGGHSLAPFTRTQNNAYVMSYLCARAIFKHLSIAELALSRFTAARIVTMSIDQLEVSSIIRGHHVYKHNWSSSCIRYAVYYNTATFL